MNTEVYAHLFSIVHQREYAALACCCQTLSKMTLHLQTQLTPESDSATSFYKGVHFTVYQTAVLRHLLRYGADAWYTTMPDVFNLIEIACAYSDLKGVPFEFIGPTGILESKYTKLSYVCSRREKRTATAAVIFADFKLNCATKDHNRVHPSFEQEQLYSVWVIDNQLNKTPPCYNTRAVNLYPGYSYTKQNFMDKLTFFIAADPFSINNFYAILSQIPSKASKRLIISLKPKESAFIPLPLQCYRQYKGRLKRAQRLPPYIALDKVTYTEMMDIQNSTFVPTVRINVLITRRWLLIDPLQANDTVIENRISL